MQPVRRFFYDTKYFWIGCNRFPPCNYDVPRLVRLLYAAEFAYYLQVSPVPCSPALTHSHHTHMLKRKGLGLPSWHAGRPELQAVCVILSLGTCDCRACRT